MRGGDGARRSARVVSLGSQEAAWHDTSERTERAEAATRQLLAMIVAYVDAACAPGKLREALDAHDALVRLAERTGWVHPKDRPKKT